MCSRYPDVGPVSMVSHEYLLNVHETKRKEKTMASWFLVRWWWCGMWWRTEHTERKFGLSFSWWMAYIVSLLVRLLYYYMRCIFLSNVRDGVIQKTRFVQPLKCSNSLNSNSDNVCWIYETITYIYSTLDCIFYFTASVWYYVKIVNTLVLLPIISREI